MLIHVHFNFQTLIDMGLVIECNFIFIVISPIFHDPGPWGALHKRLLNRFDFGIQLKELPSLLTISLHLIFLIKGQKHQ